LARLAVLRLRATRRWTLLCRLTLMTGTNPSAATGGAHGDDDAKSTVRNRLDALTVGRCHLVDDDLELLTSGEP
jgi:hypothetical protein